jgi:hypothetical protein
MKSKLPRIVVFWIDISIILTRGLSIWIIINEPSSCGILNGIDLFLIERIVSIWQCSHDGEVMIDK